MPRRPRPRRRAAPAPAHGRVWRRRGGARGAGAGAHVADIARRRCVVCVTNAAGACTSLLIGCAVMYMLSCTVLYITRSTVLCAPLRIPLLAPARRRSPVLPPAAYAALRAAEDRTRSRRALLPLCAFLSPCPISAGSSGSRPARRLSPPGHGATAAAAGLESGGRSGPAGYAGRAPQRAAAARRDGTRPQPQQQCPRHQDCEIAATRSMKRRLPVLLLRAEGCRGYSSRFDAPGLGRAQHEKLPQHE
jgi:hypothetical protein